MVEGLTEAYKPLFDLFDDIKNNRAFQGKYKTFIYDLPGGRGSGKTGACERLLLASIFFKTSVNIELFRYMTSDRDEMGKNIIEQAVQGDIFHYYEGNKYELIYNNQLRVDGVRPTDPNKPIKLGRTQKKCKYKIIYIDEFFEFKNDHGDKLSQSFRNYEYLLIIRSSNPGTELQGGVKDCYDLFTPNEPKLIKEGSQVIQKGNRIVHGTHAGINGHNLPDGIKEQYDGYLYNDPLTARVVCYGLPGMVKGSVFGHLLPKISAVIQPTNMYVGGLDYGYKKDMTICNLMGADGLFKYINVISEYGWDNYTQGHKDHFQIAKEVVAFYLELSRRYSEMRRGIIVYCDNAEQSFISILNQQANKMVIGINNGLSFKPCIKLRIETRTGKLTQLMSESRLNISLECRTLLKELRLYAWDQNKATLTPLDKDNHAIDALCYALTGGGKYLESKNFNNFM